MLLCCFYDVVLMGFLLFCIPSGTGMIIYEMIFLKQPTHNVALIGKYSSVKAIVNFQTTLPRRYRVLRYFYHEC